MGGVILNLVPDAAHVDGDGGAVPHIVIAPDALEQLLLGKDNVGVFRQELQQLKLPVGHLDLPIPFEHLPALGEDAQIAHLDHSIVLAPAAGQPLIPEQMGLHPGHQLRRVKGFSDVVIRPQAKTPDFVHRLGAGGDH